MSAPPPLFDCRLRDLRRARAQRSGLVDFLHVEAADIIQERLKEVNRPFRDAVVATPAGSAWAAALPRARIIDDTGVLDVAPASADLAIHGLALHGAGDPVGQLIQLRRALRPDGLMIAVLFGGQTLAELRASLAEAEIAVRGGLSPRVAPMGEIRDLGALVQRAGLALPVADAITLTVTYETPLALMRELRGMGETNILGAQSRGFLRRDVLMQACEIYTRNFGVGGGRIKATFELVFLTGWAPSDDQQRPLRPGSAAARLADALDTTELPAGEKAGGD